MVAFTPRSQPKGAGVKVAESGWGWGWGLGLGLDGWFSLFACGFPLDVDTILVDSPDYELRSSLRHRIDLEDD